MRQINKIILHCSASDVPAHDDISVVKQWHTLPKMPAEVKRLIELGRLPKSEAFKYGNGWKNIGYHWFITSNGKLQYGRAIGDIGAHCKGHNHDSIGICLHGKNKFHAAQFGTLRTLLASLDFALQIKDVYGHRDFDKAKPFCPGFDYKQILAI